MIIALSGLSGVGKDSIADILVRNHGFCKLALADQIKRMARDAFGFTDEQMFGPSESRNAPDPRYPRQHISDGHHKCLCCGFEAPSRSISDEGYPKCYLTPRYALQTLGTEYGRNCYPDVWVEYAVRVVRELLEGGFVYSAKKGLESEYGHPSCPQFPYKGVVISDVRFKNEILGLKKAGAKLVRIRRPGYEQPKWDHPSETEQMSVPDEEFDLVINNQETLEELAENISFILNNGILDHE
jgi:hypothetical protein